MTQAAQTTDDLLREMLAVQLAILLEQRAIRQALERDGRGARDDADGAMFLAIREAVGDRQFTSAELMALAAIKPALRAALLAVDCSDTEEAGIAFRGLKDSTIGGLRLEHCGRRNGGVLWRVTVCR